MNPRISKVPQRHNIPTHLLNAEMAKEPRASPLITADIFPVCGDTARPRLALLSPFSQANGRKIRIDSDDKFGEHRGRWGDGLWTEQGRRW